MKAKDNYNYNKGAWGKGKWLQRYLFKKTARKKFSHNIPSDEKPITPDPRS